MESIDYEQQSATVVDSVRHKTVVVEHGKNVGPWTLMAILKSDLAVFENLQDRKGEIV